MQSPERGLGRGSLIGIGLHCEPTELRITMGQRLEMHGRKHDLYRLWRRRRVTHESLANSITDSL
jgi:hypothetical protein